MTGGSQGKSLSELKKLPQGPCLLFTCLCFWFKGERLILEKTSFALNALSRNELATALPLVMLFLTVELLNGKRKVVEK